MMADPARPSPSPPILLKCPHCSQLMAFYEARLPDHVRTYECLEHGFFTLTEPSDTPIPLNCVRCGEPMTFHTERVRQICG